MRIGARCASESSRSPIIPVPARAAHLTDHRDVYHHLALPQHPWLGLYTPELPPRTLERARLEIFAAQPGLGWRRRLQWLSVVLILSGASYAWTAWNRPLLSAIYSMPAWLQLPALLISRTRLPRAESRIVASALVNQGHCGCCAYDLHRAVPDPADGCTPCPECGAAWRV